MVLLLAIRACFAAAQGTPSGWGAVLAARWMWISKLSWPIKAGSFSKYSSNRQGGDLGQSKSRTTWLQHLETWINKNGSIGEQDVFLASAAGHDLFVIPNSPWGCCGPVGIGKRLFWRRIMLQASELEWYSPLSVRDRYAGQKGCWDGGSYERQIGKSILGQTMRECLMHCYHRVGCDLWSAVCGWSTAFREKELSWEQGRVTRASVRVESQSSVSMLVFLNAPGGYIPRVFIWQW